MMTGSISLARAAVAAVVLAVTAACRDSTEPDRVRCDSATLDATQATVTLVWKSRPDTMRTLVEGNAAIRGACAYLAGESQANIPAGQIVRGSAPADPTIPFHYIPTSIEFVEVAIELCDSALLRTAAAVNEYFIATGHGNSTSAPYCPWTARPVLVEAVTP